ncbi:MAG: zinc ribbon domain-containing protein [Promethearchaeota archaeon]|nr:MAG: zinc ribbon domain-containing protein [Candidatus Lokiarchaeota archaeon]
MSKMSTTAATQRCPRCGNEVRSDSYTCAFCGKRLREELIERTPIFKRIEEEWYAPASFFKKLLYLFINPPRAFWEINHERKKSPGSLIVLFSSIAWGFIGLSIFIHLNFAVLFSTFPPEFRLLIVFFYGLLIFLFFFLFGYVFQKLFFKLLIWLYTKGANYAVNYSERLEQRFGTRPQEKRDYEERDLSPFSIYRGGTLLQTQEAFRVKMMMSAFAPVLIINLIKALLLAIALPNVSVINLNPVIINSALSEVLDPNLPVWAVCDLLDFLTLAIWIPYLITISIRELANSGTWRVLLSSYIISILAGIILYLMRPTLLG